MLVNLTFRAETSHCIAGRGVVCTVTGTRAVKPPGVPATLCKKGEE